MTRHSRRIILTLAAVASALALPGCLSTIKEGEIEQGPAARPQKIAPDPGGIPRSEGWREWRGSLRDGIVAGVDLTADLPPRSWPEAWRVRTGDGLSGLVVAGGRVYCHSRLGLEEVVTCHDAASGSVLWSRTSPLETDFDQPFFASRITNGPLSTPTIADGRI
ncbi:MAG TPA: hypothetical protein VMT52_06110, partial [Planctomycetota bacterium]|nr:hypothetical protein [Planctomycetota bacterium]